MLKWLLMRTWCILNAIIVHYIIDIEVEKENEKAKLYDDVYSKKIYFKNNKLQEYRELFIINKTEETEKYYKFIVDKSDIPEYAIMIRISEKHELFNVVDNNLKKLNYVFLKNICEKKCWLIFLSYNKIKYLSVIVKLIIGFHVYQVKKNIDEKEKNIIKKFLRNKYTIFIEQRLGIERRNQKERRKIITNVMYEKRFTLNRRKNQERRKGLSLIGDDRVAI